MTAIEFYDGLLAEWGASPTDLLFNTPGTGLFIGQQLLWHEQRYGLSSHIILLNMHSIAPTCLAILGAAYH